MLLGDIIDNISKNPTFIAFSEVFKHTFGFSFNGDLRVLEIKPVKQHAVVRVMECGNLFQHVP